MIGFSKSFHHCQDATKGYLKLLYFSAKSGDDMKSETSQRLFYTLFLTIFAFFLWISSFILPSLV